MPRRLRTGSLPLAFGLLLGCALTAGAQPRINEYVSSNITGIVDEDGDTSDWLEIYNPGTASFELTGCGLSDDPDEPFQWVFPDMVILPDAHLLLFASEKDRRVGAAHWETVIDWGDGWRYRANLSAPPSNWRDTGFDDSGWSEGPSGFGYGDGDDATEVPPCPSVAIRRTFSVDDPGQVHFICLHVDYDDAFVAYLNGEEIARANITSPGPPDWDQAADEDREALVYQGGMPETFLISETGPLLQAGSNLLAIEVHNSSPSSSDLTLIPFLTLGMDEAPPGAEGVAEFIRLLIPLPHTNFKIAAEGEPLLLCDPQGQGLDEIDTGRMYADISRGRSPDGGAEWYLFPGPTPGGPNGEGIYTEFAAAPQFSVPGGFYSSSVPVAISSPSPQATIYYTLDGGDPDETAHLYTDPVTITSTTALRARAFEPGYLPSRITTHTYIFDEETTLPVMSLVTDPPNLWDSEIGIYVLGDDYDPEEPYFGANFWQDWERPMHYEYFEVDGALGFRLDAGVKIHGGYTRAFPQKSLRLHARPGYGTPTVDYRIFDEKPIDSFHHVVLRNAGNDWYRCFFRDALIHRLAAHTGIEYQAYSPVRTYLNGEYWGIHNLRERIDEYFLEANAGVDPENVDLLEIDGTYVLAGDSDHYLAMLAYIEQHGIADSVDYAYIQTQMDVANFQTYEIFEIFVVNTDWPGNNIRFWRPRTPGGRWRWMMLDLDLGLGLEDPYTYNMLALALEPDGPEWPNPPWSTFLLRSLMTNEEFRNSFINRYADHLNSSFLPERTIAMAAGVVAGIESEIDRHLDRWGLEPWEWPDDVGVILEFLQERPAYARDHLEDRYGLSPLTLSLDIYPPGGGSVRLTAIEVDSTWSGTYYREVPISLTALPAPGYVFERWSDPDLPEEETVRIQPDSDYTVTALFEAGQIDPDAIVINEINYNSSADFDPRDWVELHNRGDVTLDLSGWQFRDENDTHTFDLPAGLVLPGQQFVVLCEDTAAFRAHFADAGPLLGNFDFGLSGGGELLRLFDGGGVLRDWVLYDDDPPWPPEPDGLGPTLELINPDLDNTQSEHWAVSADHGTPGAINSAWEPAATPDDDARPALALRRPFPNPSGPRTQIEFWLDRARVVDLAVYDVTGRRVALLAAGRRDPGQHRVSWTGRDKAGRRLPAGVYLVRMDTRGFSATRKLMLLR